MKFKALAPGRPLRIKRIFLVTELSGAIILVRAAETPPKPLFPNSAPVCRCESLAKVSLPATTIDFAAIEDEGSRHLLVE